MKLVLVSLERAVEEELKTRVSPFAFLPSLLSFIKSRATSGTTLGPHLVLLRPSRAIFGTTLLRLGNGTRGSGEFLGVTDLENDTFPPGLAFDLDVPLLLKRVGPPLQRPNRPSGQLSEPIPTNSPPPQDDAGSAVLTILATDQPPEKPHGLPHAVGMLPFPQAVSDTGVEL